MSKQANENEENPSTEGNSESTESVEAGPPAVASAPEAGAEAGTGAGESAPAESDSSASPESPAEGWYPDPNAGGANVMRYWNGSAWTEKIKEGQTELNTTIRPPVERKAILAQQLQEPRRVGPGSSPRANSRPSLSRVSPSTTPCTQS